MALASSIIAANKEERTSAVLFTHNAAPYVGAGLWTKENGFGTKLADPTSSETVGAGTINPNAARNAFITGLNGGSTFLAAYKFNASTGGFGTKYSNPASLPGSSTDISPVFNPSDSIVVAGSGVTPYVYAYPWSNTNGFGTKYANPSTLVTTPTRALNFNSAGTALFFSGQGQSGRARAYKWSAAGWGTKYTDSSIAGGTNTIMIQGNTANTAVFVSADNTPGQAAWPWNDVTGFGTIYTTISPVPAASANGRACVDKNMRKYICGSNTTPFIYSYRWNNTTGWGSRYTAPTAATGQIATTSISPDGASILGTMVPSPYVQAYIWLDDNQGWGAKYAGPTGYNSIGTTGFSSITFI